MMMRWNWKATGMLFILFFLVVVTTSSYAAPKVYLEVTATTTKIGGGTDAISWATGLQNLVVDGSKVFALYKTKPSSTSSINGSEIHLVASFNGGRHWEGNQTIAYGDANGGIGNSKYGSAELAIGPDPLDPEHNILHVVWDAINATTGIREAIHTSGTVDNKGKWTTLTTSVVSNPSIGLRSNTLDLAADATGAVHVIYNDSTGLRYSNSLDGGRSFGEIGTLIDSDTTHNSRSMTMSADKDGNVFAVWRTYDQLDKMLFSKREAGSSVWLTPTAVNLINYNNNHFYPSISVFDAYNVNVAYTTATGAYVATTSDGGVSWSTHTFEEGDDIWEVSIAQSIDGNLSAAWWSPAGTTISSSTDFGLSWTTPQLILNDPDYWYPNLAIDESGKKLLMWGALGDNDVFMSSGNLEFLGGIYFSREK